MIKVPYDQIIAKISEHAKLSETEITSKIKAKMDQLAGLISKEGAAHIIANELGVKLMETPSGKAKIKNIVAGMRSVETIGKITAVYETREFQRSSGIGKVGSFFIADDTGSIRVVLWNDQTDLLQKLQKDMTVKIQNAFSKENNNTIELHMANKSELIINPEGETISNVKQSQRKHIEQLTGIESGIELMGTIVQLFEPRFYEIDPKTGRRIKPKEDNKFYNDDGQEVIPDYGYVLNAVLDDGTSTIRTVFFRNQVLTLLGLTHENILKYKENIGDFQTIKEDFLGKMIKVIGRTTKNDMFDRIEFITQTVYPNPDPDEELQRLAEEAKIIE